MPQFPEDDTSSLERARERLYRPAGTPRKRVPLAGPGDRSLPHEWSGDPLERTSHRGERHVRIASIFFIVAVIFFFIAFSVAGYFFYFGGNAVSVDKIDLDIQGPTTIAGGDTVPLSLTITNKNPAAIEDATIEIDFPNGTRAADNILQPYQRYVENLGTLASGASVTRSVKAVLFGSTGQSITLPVSLSYGTAGSNAVFVKKTAYTLAISATPLSVSVDTLSETVSNKPLTFTLTVRSNATVPLSNVVLVGAFPFGFLPTSSSLPLNNSSFLIGTIAPGATKTVTLTGTLTGQNKEQRVFRFTVGTADTSNNQTPSITYMTQDATVTIAAPFIDTTLAVNGDTSGNMLLSSGRRQSVTVSYTNTLPTNVGNASVVIALSGTAIDYNSIQTTSGFYNSANHTILFSRDTDPSLAVLAPGASGVGAFTFATVPPESLAASPTVNFTISVSGTRVGQSNVPETVNATVTKSFKVITAIVFIAASRHTAAPLTTAGPIPPRAEQSTTYAIVWTAQSKGSAVADGTVTAVLPSYVSYTGLTTGKGAFVYDEKSRTVSWNLGDLAQGGSAEGAFQVSLTPSLSQKGSAPNLTGQATFSGYDRFAGTRVSSVADPVTTETTGDPGYVPDAAIVVQ